MYRQTEKRKSKPMACRTSFVPTMVTGTVNSAPRG